jgi:O-6-methylguanine DNA methyltransferase
MKKRKYSPVKELEAKIVGSESPEFYKLVWLECLKIPRGATVSYSELARRIGRPGSQRAVGNALGKNPFAPRVPCHRVIKKDGSLGGYSGAMGKKEKLLRDEKALPPVGKNAARQRKNSTLSRKKLFK